MMNTPEGWAINLERASERWRGESPALISANRRINGGQPQRSGVPLGVGNGFKREEGYRTAS